MTARASTRPRLGRKSSRVGHVFVPNHPSGAVYLGTMRRILAALAVGLVAAGPAAASPHLPTAANRRLAQRDAQRLLGLIVPPPGAHRLRAAPRGDDGLLHGASSVPGYASLVDLHRLWRVREPLAATASFVEAHLPRTARWAGSGVASGPGMPSNTERTYSLRAVPGRLALRWLNLVFVSLPGGWTGVRADAQVAWVVARPASEVLPAAVRRVDIEVGYPGQRPKISLDVTRTAEVRRIVGLLDGLPIVQAETLHCPVMAAAHATFSFRTADGTLLARASMSDLGTAGPCDPIELTMGGLPQKPLAGAFLSHVQRLLGVRLLLPSPTAG